MASRKSFFSKPGHIFPSTSDSETHFNQKSIEGVLELDEAEVWNTVAEGKKVHPAPAGSLSAPKRGSRKVEVGGGVSHVSSSSLPVNIPDWSKILKEDCKEHWKRDSDDNVVGDGDGDGGIRVPPHEYLARTRGASLSVHEGRGRTLKGRDLRSVRNAIWKKVGFED